MSAVLKPRQETKSLIRGYEVKAIDDVARTFTGMAAAFSLDQGGDVILPGAFKRTLADWKRSAGRIIPLIDSHNYRSVRAIVGKMVAAEETAKGLQTTHEVITGPDGDEIWRRVKGGFVTAMSIGYRAIETRMPSVDEQRTGIQRFLKEIALEENSLVIFPMNDDARLDQVKALLRAAKERTLEPAELDELKEIESEIRALLAPAAPDPAKADPATATPGLALEDPRRIALDARIRGLALRRLGVQ